jgi:aspartate aminotransferase-like enzyme
VAAIARACDLALESLDELGPSVKLVLVPLIDPWTGQLVPVRDVAAAVHASGARILVDATIGLGACELRLDDWGVDLCVAGVDCTLGGPAGISLIAYSSEVAGQLARLKTPPRTSYLDLIQLQAYWSPQRLNHHTAPTSLVYGLREALRLIHERDIVQRWQQHQRVGEQLRTGLRALGLEVSGDRCLSIVSFPPGLGESELRRRLLDDYDVYVTRAAPHTWRVGLLGADATPANVNRLLAVFEKVFGR